MGGNCCAGDYCCASHPGSLRGGTGQYASEATGRNRTDGNRRELIYCPANVDSIAHC